MTSTTDPFDALDAFLRQDFGTYDQIVDQISGQELAIAFAIVFFLVFDERFEDKAVTDVVRFVAEARARFDETGDDIDPQVAERLVRAAAFDEQHLVTNIDKRTVGKVQPALLAAAVEMDQWDDDKLRSVLNAARQMAAQRGE